MRAKVENQQENQSKAVANSWAKKNNNVKQGAEFQDNRAETIAQRKINLIASSQKNQEIKSPPLIQNSIQTKDENRGSIEPSPSTEKHNASTQNMIQLKRLSGFSLGARKNGKNKVWFSDGETEVNAYWEMAAETKTTRSSLIQDIAEKASILGNEADQQASTDGWNFDSEDADRNDIAYRDPMRLRIKGKYGPDDAREDLNLDYHFGSSWHGYIIRVDDSGKNVTKDMKVAGIHEVDDETEYSNIHEIDNNPEGPLASDDGADAVTKLAGEGARWKAISDNLTIVSDTSRLYSNENNNSRLTNAVRNVTFQVLWKSWAASFGKGFGISNNRLITELKKANLKITTGAGVVDSPINTAPANTMVYGKDICVDEVGPTQQGDLITKQVQYLSYGKADSVAESDQSLQQQSDAVKQLINAVAGITTKNTGGYIGDDMFSFLCEVTANTNTSNIGDGYAQALLDNATLRYPSYRAAKVENDALNSPVGALVTGGPAAYEEERLQSRQDYITEYIAQYQNSWGAAYEMPVWEVIEDDNFPFDEVASFDVVVPNVQSPAEDTIPDGYGEQAGKNDGWAAGTAAGQQAGQAERDRQIDAL